MTICRREEIYQSTCSLPPAHLERLFAPLAFSSHAVRSVIFRRLLSMPDQHYLCRRAALAQSFLGAHAKSITTRGDDSQASTYYSYLSAISGSTFVALRAGIKQAINATLNRTSGTAANVTRSVGVTWNNRCDITRVIA